MSREIFVGIDVCKAWPDVARVPDSPADEPGTLAVRVDNDESARAVLVQQLKQLRPALVVLEATGGFETALASELCAAGVAVITTLLGRWRELGALDRKQVAALNLTRLLSRPWEREPQPPR